MSYEYQTRRPPFGEFGIPLPKMVKFFLIANLCVFLLLILLQPGGAVYRLFGLTPALVLQQGMIWQPFTYLFIHAGWMHLILNSIALYFFGSDVEREMGSRNFCLYYLFCGVGAGMLAVLFNPGSQIPTVGASGSVFGLLLAYGVLFPRRLVSVFLFFVLPIQMQARHLALFFGLTEFLFLVNEPAGGSDISRIAHLGGLLFGYLYLRYEIYILDFVTKVEGWVVRREGTPDNASESERETYIARTIDPILDKISKQGIHSLTRRERKILQRAKKKFTGKF